MKKVNNLVIGGIQQKVFNLVLVTILLMMAAYTAVIIFQSGRLEALVGETNELQRQSISEISQGTMDAVLDADDAGPLPTPVRKLPFGPGESILCLADNRLLRSIPWLSLVEIGPGRHVIALDDEITVEKFEIALGDLLDEPPAGTREEEIVAVRALLDMVRAPRRRNVLRTKSLLVVPAR